ncbi:MAG: hypothetical protein WAO49_01800 [Arcanobacterium sp.]
MKEITHTDQDLIIDLTKNEQRQKEIKEVKAMKFEYTKQEEERIEQLEQEAHQEAREIELDMEELDPSSEEYKEASAKITKIYDSAAREIDLIYNQAELRAFKKISVSAESIIEDAKNQAQYSIINVYETMVAIYKTEKYKEQINETSLVIPIKSLTEKEKNSLPADILKNKILLKPSSALNIIRSVLKLHLNALKKNAAAFKELEDFIIDLVANTPYIAKIDIKQELNKFVSKPLKKEPLKKEISPLNDFYYMYHSKPTNALISMSSKNAKSKDLYGKNAIIEKDDVKLEIIDFNSIRGALGVSTNKLLSAALIEFTKQNTEADLTKNNINTRVSIPLKDYALACGYEVEEKITKNMNKEEIEKEKERASNALKYVRKQINKDLNILFASKVSWKETSKRFKNKDFMDYRFIVGKGIRKGRIHIEFYSGFSDNMVQQAITPYPLALFKVDAGKPTAYAIGRKMATHYGMNNNIIKGTYNRLKVQTLLDVTDLPTLENVRQSRNSWYERIKEPLENALDHLTSKEVNFLKDWTYCKPLGKTMTKEEANFTNKPFEEWANTLILFEVVDAPSYKDRLKQLEEKKKENIKKKKGK